MAEYRSMSSSTLITALEQAGPAPVPELLRACLARRIELTPRLLELFREAIDDEWDDDEDPRWYRAVHCGYLLIAFRARAALPTFEVIYANDDAYDWLIEWFEESPSHYGVAAIPTFASVLQSRSSTEWSYGCSMAAEILRHIALQYPGTRDQVIASLRAQLPALLPDGRLTWSKGDEIDLNWSSIVMSLAFLMADECTPQVMAMFEADLLDEFFIEREGFLEEVSGMGPRRRSFHFDLMQAYGLPTADEDT